MEGRPNAVPLGNVELPDESIGAHDIRDSKIPSGHIGGAVGAQGSNADVLRVTNRTGVVGEILKDLQPARVGRWGGIIHLPVVAEGESVLQRVIPDKTGRG